MRAIGVQTLRCVDRVVGIEEQRSKARSLVSGVVGSAGSWILYHLDSFEPRLPTCVEQLKERLKVSLKWQTGHRLEQNARKLARQEAKCNLSGDRMANHLYELLARFQLSDSSSLYVTLSVLC